MEDIFNIKLLWGLDQLPKYHVLIHALISEQPIDEQIILQTLNQKINKK